MASALKAAAEQQNKRSYGGGSNNELVRMIGPVDGTPTKVTVQYTNPMTKKVEKAEVDYYDPAPTKMRVLRLATNEEIVVSFGADSKVKVADFFNLPLKKVGEGVYEQARPTDTVSPAGTVLQLDSLKKQGDEYTSSWGIMMTRRESDNVLVGVPTKLEVQTAKDGGQYITLDVVDTNRAQLATSGDDFEALVTKALAENGPISGGEFGQAMKGVMVRAKAADGDVATLTYRVWDPETKTAPEAGERAAAIVGPLKDAIAEAIAAGEQIEVTPILRLSAGSKAVEKVLSGERAGKFISPDKYKLFEGTRRDGSAYTVNGYINSNLVTCKHPNGDGDIVIAVMPATFPSAVPLKFINSPLAPEIARTFKHDEAKANQAKAEAAAEDEAHADANKNADFNAADLNVDDDLDAELAAAAAQFGGGGPG